MNILHPIHNDRTRILLSILQCNQYLITYPLRYGLRFSWSLVLPKKNISFFLFLLTYRQELNFDSKGDCREVGRGRTQLFKMCFCHHF